MFGSISAARLLREKDRQSGVFNDFSIHFMECVRAVPFEDLFPGVSINGPWDDSEKTSAVVIPEQSGWTTLSGGNFLNFHPGLVSVLHLDPEMSIGFESKTNGVNASEKWVRLEVRWAGGNGEAGSASMRTDLLRIPGM